MSRLLVCLLAVVVSTAHFDSAEADLGSLRPLRDTSGQLRIVATKVGTCGGTLVDDRGEAICCLPAELPACSEAGSCLCVATRECLAQCSAQGTCGSRARQCRRSRSSWHPRN